LLNGFSERYKHKLTLAYVNKRPSSRQPSRLSSWSWGRVGHVSGFVTFRRSPRCSAGLLANLSLGSVSPLVARSRRRVVVSRASFWLWLPFAVRWYNPVPANLESALYLALYRCPSATSPRYAVHQAIVLQGYKILLTHNPPFSRVLFTPCNPRWAKIYAHMSVLSSIIFQRG
jgi:hypothetical protein